MKLLVLAAVGMVSLQAPVTVTGGAMTFGWPVGVTARVETEYVREDGEPAREVSRLRMAHRMRVLAHAEGRQILNDQHRTIEAAGDLQPAAAALLPLWIPTTIVGVDGRFVRIEGAGRVREVFLDASASHLRTMERFPALRDYVTSMTADSVMTRLQSAEWLKLVPQWLGMPSAPEPFEVKGSAPMLPGVTVASRSTISVTNRRPCVRGGETLTCATFEMKTAYDPQSLAAVVARLEKESPGVLPDGVTPLEFEEVVRVTMETGSMLPHELVVTRLNRVQATVNGQVLTGRDAERRRSVFDYDAERQ